MMYYGNAGASNQQDKTNVWDGNYKGVWHLGEAVTDESTSGTHADSSSNGNTGLQRNNSLGTGQIGGAQSFDGSLDWITVPTSASLDVTSQLTMEAWVNLANSNNDQKILGKTNDVVTRGYLLGIQNNMLYPEIWDTAGTRYSFTSGGVPSATWTHVALTWQSSGNMIGYVNGAQVNSIAASGNNIGVGTKDARIGISPWDNPQFPVNGRIDEVRISSTVRSGQWIATEYANMNSPSTFSTLGTEVGSPCSVTPTPTPTPSFPWYDCNWAYRKNITIDHSKVSGTQASFPVLVSLTADPDLSASAQADGDDILFTSADGVTKIPHEIESYSAGTLVAWVNVPSLSSTTDTVIMMYYGNTGAASQQNPTGVWDSNFVVVQHMNGASSAALDDSTANNNDVTSQIGTPTYQQTGKIGTAVRFTGSPDSMSGDAVEIPDAASLDLSSQVTACAWIKPVPASSFWNRIIAKSHTSNAKPWTMYGLMYDDHDHIRSEIGSGEIRYHTNGNTATGGNAWLYGCAVYDHSSILIYLNGNADNATPKGLSGNMDTNNMPLSIARSGFGSDYFNGTIDEVRVSSTARTTGWIKTEYNTMNSPATFYAVGTAVSAPCGSAPAGWYSCSWGYRKSIIIDHTKVTGTLSNFPVLVSLASDNELSARAQASGADIFFTSSDGTTKIPHEIESYNGATGALVAWVKVPSLTSAADTTIMMYYGNPSAASQQDATNVWDTSYKSVLHLKEDPSGAAPQVKDSTTNANHGTSADWHDERGPGGGPDRRQPGI